MMLSELEQGEKGIITNIKENSEMKRRLQAALWLEKK